MVNNKNSNDDDDSDDDNDNNSIYNHVEPNLYFYDCCEKLTKNIDISLFNKVNICIYQVNNKAKYPFLQFLLSNDKKNGVLAFPTFNIKNIPKNILLVDTKSLLAYIQFYFGILFEGTEELCKSTFRGFFIDETNKTVNAFYDFSDCCLNLDMHSYKHKIWIALIDDIVNKENVAGFKIDSNVTSFFILNQQFLSLLNDEGEKYEIPVSCYIGKENKYLNFTYLFGSPKMNNTAILGPYYYFTNFNNAMQQLNMQKGGVIRFAVFLGKMLVKLNYPDDSIDESDFKREKIRESLYEQLTLRITDYDGLWGETYDSCFIGKIELDNGDKIMDAPIFAVKNYEQQYPLNYFLTNNEFNGII